MTPAVNVRHTNQHDEIAEPSGDGPRIEPRDLARPGRLGSAVKGGRRPSPKAMRRTLDGGGTGP